MIRILAERRNQWASCFEKGDGRPYARCHVNNRWGCICRASKGTNTKSHQRPKFHPNPMQKASAIHSGSTPISILIKLANVKLED